MPQRYRSRRQIKRLSRKSKWNFLISLILIGILLYSTIIWILPNFIGGISFITNKIKPPQIKIVEQSQNSSLAPPILNIPYEATNTAQINISGYGTPGSKVKLFIDDEEKDTIDVSEDGSFSFEDISLNLGRNNIYSKTVDEEDKESLASKTLQLSYINDKPNLTISEPEDNKKIQGGDKKVKVSGKTDPGIKIFVSGSQVIISNDGTFSTDLPLTDGDNDLLIKAEDQAGNTTEIQRRVNYTP